MLNSIKFKIAKFKHEIIDWAFDAYFRINTRATTAEHIDPQGIRNEYSPIDWISFPKILSQLNIQHEDVFIDIGSGRGRALLIASLFPFKKIIGIDYQRNLCDEARRNLKTALNFKSICKNITILQEDVETYDFPKDITVILLNNPFEKKLVQTTLNKIKASLREFPRRAFIIYRAPVYYNIFGKDEDFKEIPIEINKYRARYKIYQFN